MRTIRAISAAVLLLGQFFWLAAPAACHMPESAACHQTTQSGHQNEPAPANPGPVGCAMLAACGPVLQGVVASPLVLSAPPAPGRDLPRLIAPLLGSDPTAPPSPPPQA